MSDEKKKLLHTITKPNEQFSHEILGLLTHQDITYTVHQVFSSLNLRVLVSGTPYPVLGVLVFV